MVVKPGMIVEVMAGEMRFLPDVASAPGAMRGRRGGCGGDGDSDTAHDGAASCIATRMSDVVT